MTTPKSNTVEFKIEGMDCGSCVRTIEGAVGAVPGVDAVTVSLADNNAMITRDPTLVSDQVIIDAIEEVGFDVVK